MSTDALATVTLVAAGCYLGTKSAFLRRLVGGLRRDIEGTFVLSKGSVVEVFFAGAITVSLLCSLCLLGYSYVVQFSWIFPPVLIWACIIAVVGSLAMYLAAVNFRFGRVFPGRWVAYAVISIGMLPSMLPVGVCAGFAIASTGVWNDRVGEHSDSDIGYVFLFALMGLLSGPIVSYCGVRAASRRSKRD